MRGARYSHTANARWLRTAARTCRDRLAARLGALTDGASSDRTDRTPSTDRGRPMTDGGWPDGEPDDEDPFTWGPEIERSGSPTEPDDADDPPVEQSHNPDRDKAPDRDIDGPVVATDGATPAPPGDPGEEADLQNRLHRMEERLDRLADLASDVTITAMNGDIKLSRREPDELEMVHQQLQVYADHIDREVQRLRDQLDDLGDQMDAMAERRRIHRARLTAQGSSPLVEGTAEPLPADADDDEDEQVPSPMGAEPPERIGKSPGIVPPAPEQPVEELLPDAKLRDMWRIGASATNGDGGLTKRSYERWILEATPKETDEKKEEDQSPEFPPEVTEFTLDDDEIPFEVLLEIIHEDESS